MTLDVSYDPLQGNPLPVYGSWTPAHYKALGLMVGLEVHQQLQTRPGSSAAARRCRGRNGPG